MKSRTRKNFLNKYSIIITLIIFLSSFNRITYTNAQIETTVLGIDSAEDLEAGTIFVLSIYLVDVSKTTGVGLDLTWNPSVLTLQEVIISASAPVGTTLWNPNIDNDLGSLKIAITNTNSPDYITVIEKTPILDLTFEAIGLPGDSTILSLENVELSDEYFEVYSPDVVKDGVVSIKPEVVNQNPVAKAGGPYSGKEGGTITFDGTGSYDPDGTIVSYEWDFGDGGTGTGETPSHAYASTGTYTVILKVTDDEGAYSSDTTTTTISKPAPPPSSGGGGGGSGSAPDNKPPVADAGPDRTVYVDVIIHLSAAGSKDPDGTIEVYHWFFGDGGYKSGVRVKHIYKKAGFYNASLTVEDNNGATGTDSCIVTVRPMPAIIEAKFIGSVPANQTSFVNATEESGTTVTVNTTGKVTVTVLRFEENPHPEDLLPERFVPKFVDVSVSDPDAVVWPIYVEMFYTDEEVEGLDESSLGIYYWKDGAWNRCNDTGVDTENNVVWAYMTAEEAAGSPILMGGMPAILVPPLPPILSELTVTPSEIELGEEVTISFVVENLDSQPYTYVPFVQIGEVFLVKGVELDGYESKTVSHTITPIAVGNYDVTVEGMTGSFTVVPIPIIIEPVLRPAEFVVTGLMFLEPEVEVGEENTITVAIENVGEQSGNYTVILRMESGPIVIVKDKNITIEGGGAKLIDFTFILDVEGIYEAEVEGMTVSFTVLPPPEEPPFWMQPIYVAGIIIVIIAAAAIIYAYRKGMIPLPSARAHS